MKYILVIIITAAFSLNANSQRKNRVKKNYSKIKNNNILIAPDQKPVIIERTEDPIIVRRKHSAVTRKNNLPSGQTKKRNHIKSVRAFAPVHRKKAALLQRKKL